MRNVNAEFKCREIKAYLRTMGVLPQVEVLLSATLPRGDLLLLPFSTGPPPCQESHTRKLMRVPSCAILFSLILGSWIQPFSCSYLVSSSFLLLFHWFTLPAS